MSHHALYFHTFPNKSSCPNPVVCTGAPDVVPPALNAPHSSSSLLFAGAAGVNAAIPIEGPGLFVPVVAVDPHVLEERLVFPIDVPQAGSLLAAVEIVGAGVAQAFVSNENCGVVGCFGAAALKLNTFMEDVTG